MDTKQARFILQACRASGADANDPQFADALRQVERDPALAEWFTRERSLDAAIGRKLRDVPAPRELRETILAGQAVAQAPTTRRRFAPLALAAVLALLAAIAAVWFGAGGVRKDFAAYRSGMMEKLSAGLQFEFTSADLGQVREWLASQRQVTGYEVPAGLRKLPSLGCRTWEWRGKPVALICFSLGDGRAAHLLVVSRAAISNPPANTAPEFAPRENWATASWTEGDFVYLVARKGDEVSLRQLLNPKA